MVVSEHPLLSETLWATVALAKVTGMAAESYDR